MADDLAAFNLGDVFLNASLLRRSMHAAPLVVRDADNPEQTALDFPVSDRGRFERLWVTQLAVLVEAWERADPEVRAKVETPALRDALQALNAAATLGDDIPPERRPAGGTLREAIRETRDYMCHRDRRLYFDPGRFVYMNHLEDLNRLHEAFSAALLAAYPGSRR